MLKALGGLGTFAVLGCGGSASAAAGPLPIGVCVLDPTLTRGPFWVDEGIARSDIRSDTNGRASPNPRPGVPLTLRFAVSAFASNACTPLSGAQVDVWHCDAAGIYSDVQGTSGGENFLRGYQVTGPDGVASFTTIYPGWYTGRAVHIHVKVRVFEASRNATTEATTQVFFDDSITDSVHRTVTPYSSRRSRDTRNAADGIYANQSALLLTLGGDPVSGYTGSIPLAVRVGLVNAG